MYLLKEFKQNELKQKKTNVIKWYKKSKNILKILPSMKMQIFK